MRRTAAEIERDYIETSCGQLCFFRWCFENNILDYVKKNYGCQIMGRDIVKNLKFKKHAGKHFDPEKFAQLLGILFAEYQILTTEQASIVRQQMDRPSHVYVDSNSLWAFYNFVTIALQHSHPKTWMEDQRVLHYFISTVNNFQQCTPSAQIVAPVPVVVEAEVPSVDPNQVDLEDLIAQVEAEAAMSDAVVTYTDPAGNTFEAPVVNENDPEDEEDLNDWVNLPVEELARPEDFPGYEPDENQEYTGENSSYMKGSDFDIDKSNEELFAEEDNFGLDFTDDTNEDTDKVPDFF